MSFSRTIAPYNALGGTLNEQLLNTALTVAELGSITKASSVLFLSTQGVKSRIDTLEQELGCALFERSNTGVILTSSGRAFIEEAPSLIEHIRTFSQAVLNPENKKEILNISTWSHKRIPVFEAICLKFSQQYPDIKLSFVDTSKERMFDDIRSGVADVSLVQESVCPNGLCASRCEGLVTSYMCVTSENHPLAKSNLQSATFHMISQYSTALVALTHSNIFKDVAIEKLLPYNIYEVMNYCQNGGVCICDEYLDVRNLQLVSKPLEGAQVQIECLHRPNPSKTILDFIEIAGKVAQDMRKE